MNEVNVTVLEDDPDLAQEIQFHLVRRGMKVALVETGGQLTEHLRAGMCDVLVLDLNLPDEDGLSVAKRLAMTDELRIVILTARSSSMDRIAGIEAGADVYLTKPVDFEELAAVIRRVSLRLPAKKLGWRLDAAHLRLITPSGTPIPLTTQECDFLRCLIYTPSNGISRVRIEQALWGLSDFSTARRLEVMVSRLRKKMESSTEEELPLKTVYRHGYQFTANLSLVRGA